MGLSSESDRWLTLATTRCNCPQGSSAAQLSVRRRAGKTQDSCPSPMPERLHLRVQRGEQRSTGSLHSWCVLPHRRGHTTSHLAAAPILDGLHSAHDQKPSTTVCTAPALLEGQTYPGIHGVGFVQLYDVDGWLVPPAHVGRFEGSAAQQRRRRAAPPFSDPDAGASPASTPLASKDVSGKPRGRARHGDVSARSADTRVCRLPGLPDLLSGKGAGKCLR
jgi:hypothetical protein